jgi:hypothetical protein
VATLFGAWEQISGPAMVLVLPVAVWEMSFGVYMAVKGFRPSDTAAGSVDSTPAVGALAA